MSSSESMSETSIEVSGEMKAPPPLRESGGQNRFLDFQNLPAFQNMPSPLEMVHSVRRSLRPWTIFFNLNNFKTAVSMHRLQNRVMQNLQYFQSNYVFIFIVLMIYCLITSPFTLLVVAGVACASHMVRKRDENVNVLGIEVSPKQQVLVVNIGAIPLLFFAGAGAVLFWTLGASCFVIILHAMFYNIDAIVTEDNDVMFPQVV